jgi:hypothetical protein
MAKLGLNDSTMVSLVADLAEECGAKRSSGSAFGVPNLRNSNSSDALMRLRAVIYYDGRFAVDD